MKCCKRGQRCFVCRKSSSKHSIPPSCDAFPALATMASCRGARVAVVVVVVVVVAVAASRKGTAGVATFWKGLSWSASAIAVATASPCCRTSLGRLAVANGTWRRAEASLARCKKLRAPAGLRRRWRHQGLVLAGDFNCPLGASAASAYVALECVPGGDAVREWGHRRLPAEVTPVATAALWFGEE